MDFQASTLWWVLAKVRREPRWNRSEDSNSGRPLFGGEIADS